MSSLSCSAAKMQTGNPHTNVYIRDVQIRNCTAIKAIHLEITHDPYDHAYAYSTPQHWHQ